MAYTKRKTGYKKRGNKKMYKKPMRYKVADTAVAAFKLAKKVARFVNVEMKYSEVTWNNTQIDVNGAIYRLDDIDVGDGQTNREGISIKPMRVSGKLQIQLVSPATTSTMRCILFRGKQERTEAYEVAGSGSLAILSDNTNPFLARKNRENTFMSKFIYDKTYTMTTGGKGVIYLDWNFKMYGHVNYDDTDPEGDNLVNNGGIYLLLVSDKAGNQNPPIISGQLTTTFTDN